LDVIIQNRINANKSTSLPPWIVGLVLFGGTDPETGMSMDRNTFEDRFNKNACVSALTKVGAAVLQAIGGGTVTRACMDDKQVRRVLGDADGEINDLMVALNEANDMACRHLTQAGF
jgi:hypothetical protein